MSQSLISHSRELGGIRKLTRASTFLTLAVLLVLVTLSQSSSVLSSPPLAAPYEPSKVITNITWDPLTNVIVLADDSDNWPITWADDGDLYTAYGDGKGFPPKISDKLSLGFGKVSGSPPAAVGTNFRSATGEQLGNGTDGKKSSGLLMVDGTLYMWVRNASNDGEQCQLAWSTDRGLTWDWSTWKFSELGFCALLNFGQNYSGARDNFVYMYSPDTPSAYNETDQVVLTRVDKTQITDRSAYEFFKEFDSSGNPVWTDDITQRGSVFTFPGKGANRLDVTHNAAIGRYLMTMRSRSRDGGLNQFSIYESEEPWGPWGTVFYTEQWEGSSLPGGNGGWGESQHIPSKWISADGESFHLVYAGNDTFSIRKATLSVCPLTIGQTRRSQDLNGDGKCTDLNGNGHQDFADVIALMDVVVANGQAQSTSASFDLLDLDNNSKVDMKDVVDLFRDMLPFKTRG